MTKKPEYSGWCEISLEGPTPLMEAVADYLTSLGSGGAIFSEPGKPRTGYERMTGFLPNDAKLEMKLFAVNKYVDELRHLFPHSEISRLKLQTIVDRDWVNQWRETVVPTKVSKKFWVVPEWEKTPQAAQEPGELVIIMEPGLAFGTGFHSTTQLCLEFIEGLVPEKAKSVLDMGTGTAILAMAAAMLGAKKVMGVDIDPVSLKSAEENITRNKLKGRIELVLGGVSTQRRLSKGNWDLVTANLFMNELKRLRDYFSRHLKPGGYLVMSGILPDQAPKTIRYYRAGGFRLVEKKEKQGWAAALMKKD